MKILKAGIVLVLGLLVPVIASAHHSFAIFDFNTKVEFDGVVESLKFRNPHIEMTIKVINQDGEEELVHFLEGAPANMMVRNGIKPDMLKKGAPVHCIGSPLIEDPTKYFLRSVRTEDGTEYGI